jgi:hypothetical protein
VIRKQLAVLRGDRYRLLQEFPPRPLEGLDRNFCWGTFDRIFDFTQQLKRHEQIWRRNEMWSDAERAKEIIERLTERR